MDPGKSIKSENLRPFRYVSREGSQRSHQNGCKSHKNLARSGLNLHNATPRTTLPQTSKSRCLPHPAALLLIVVYQLPAAGCFARFADSVLA